MYTVNLDPRLLQLKGHDKVINQAKLEEKAMNNSLLNREAIFITHSSICSHLYLVFVFIQINAQQDPVRGINFAKQNARKML